MNGKLSINACQALNGKLSINACQTLNGKLKANTSQSFSLQFGCKIGGDRTHSQPVLFKDITS
ncbi:MAG: hypothetical protein NHB32_31935 [Fischerella sp. CENA71]|nr:hypothetical protein [Fischerella sp. CENA71]